MNVKYGIAILFLSLLFQATMKAQTTNSSEINPYRVVTRCSSHGITLLNNLDTYLSGYNHTGIGYNFNHENFRRAHTGKYQWRYQTLFSTIAGYTKQHSNNQFTLLAKYTWGGYHPFEINQRLQLLAGAQIQAAAGALYIPANGNNPVSAKMRLALAASGMAIYHLPINGHDYVMRYQLDIPIAGVMFSPEFGQSYYEIFGLGHTGNIWHFAHPFNSPSWKHTLSIDLPIGNKRHNVTVRLSYTADIYQSKINGLRTHIYSHAFTFGFVKTIYKVKQGDNIKAYSPY